MISRRQFFSQIGKGLALAVLAPTVAFEALAKAPAPVVQAALPVPGEVYGRGWMSVSNRLTVADLQRAKARLWINGAYADLITGADRIWTLSAPLGPYGTSPAAEALPMIREVNRANAEQLRRAQYRITRTPCLNHADCWIEQWWEE